jgi:hypothetical protein
MLPLSIILLAVMLIAFWVDVRNSDERHMLEVIATGIVGLMLAIAAPLPVRIGFVLFLLNLERFYPLLGSYQHSA